MAASTCNQSMTPPAMHWLRSQGFTVLRFWNNDILQSPDAVLESIWNAVHTNTLSPPAPLPQGARGATP
jgi:hypothetical protein